MGIPDFNNDGKVGFGEGMATLGMLGYLEDGDGGSSPSGGSDGGCGCGCMVAFGVAFVLILVLSCVSSCIHG